MPKQYVNMTCSFLLKSDGPGMQMILIPELLLLTHQERHGEVGLAEPEPKTWLSFEQMERASGLFLPTGSSCGPVLKPLTASFCLI